MESIYSSMGLAALCDANPSWELTPFFKRLTGKPKWRHWRFRSGDWVYAHNKPEVSYGGINRTSNPIWRTRVTLSPSDAPK